MLTEFNLDYMRNSALMFAFQKYKCTGVNISMSVQKFIYLDF